MRLIRTFFAFEAKRRFRVKEIAIFLIVTLLLIVLAQDGKSKYSHTLENIEVFQKTEALKVQQYILYSQYGGFGLNIMYIPPSYSVLFTESAFDGLLTNVNTVEKLNIYKGMKGRAFFSSKFDYMNFLGVILLLAVFFGLIYGYDTTRKKIFLRFLSSLANKRQIYIAAVISRILLLNLAFLVSVGISILWLLIQKINLFHLPIFLVGMGIILVVAFSFAIGCIVGTFKRINVGLISLTIIFFCAIFLIPWVIDKYNQAEASEIQSLFDFDLENIKISMEMERRILDIISMPMNDSTSSDTIKTVNGIINNEHIKLRERENRMKNDMLATIQKCSTRDAFFPILFYNSICRTVSGQSGLSFIDFYNHCQEIKKQFIDFYVRKKVESKNKRVEVESFVKYNENLYFSNVKIDSGHFWLGALMTLLYTCLALIGGYFLFLRSLYPLPRKDKEDDLHIALAKGEDVYIGDSDNRALEKFYNVLSGQIKNFTGKITLEEKNIVTHKPKEFMYLCNPTEIPGESTVNAFLKLVKGLLNIGNVELCMLKNELSESDPNFTKKKFNQITTDQKIKILLQIARSNPRPIYIIHDLEREISLDFLKVFKKEMKNLKSGGALLLYFGKSGHSLMAVDRFITVMKDENRYHYQEISQTRY